MPSSIGRSPSWVRRSSCSGILWKGSTSFGLRWFAAPELTLARPKAPHIARRALSVSPGGHVHRPAPIAMRPLRQKSSRFLSRGALEASCDHRPEMVHPAPDGLNDLQLAKSFGPMKAYGRSKL